MKGTVCMECHAEMGPETVNSKFQFMDSTAVEKYKEKLCRKEMKNAKMHEHQNSIDNFIFYFLF